MFTLLLLTAQAHAAGAAGMGTPAVGGGLAGPAQDGVEGLFSNPAAAHPESGEFLFNLQYAWSRTEMQLAGQDPTVSTGGNVIPALAVAAPAGPLGFGLALMAPYGRSSTNGPDSASRFHNMGSDVRALEADLCLAVAPTDWLSVGGAARVAQLSLDNAVAVDTGVMLAGLVDDGEAMLGDPFLEGSQRVSDASGVGGGWAVGVRVTPEAGWSLAFDYRSRLRGVAEGDLTYAPVNDLDLQVTGRAQTYMQFADEWTLAGDIPVGEARITPELSWIGWSSWSVLETRLQGLRFGSRDPIFDALLRQFGGSLEGLLADLGQSISNNGNADIFSGGVGARAPISESVTFLGGVWVTPASVPDAYASPGNLDFAVTDLRWGATWTSRRGMTLGVVNDLYLVSDRVVTTSALDPLRDPDSGLAGPSGNGSYGLELYRVGFTLEKRWGQERPARRKAGIQATQHDGDDVPTRLEDRYDILD